MARKSEAVRVISQNRRARHEYHLLEVLECGVQLQGTEVKSLRAGRASIAEAFGLIKAGELWLYGATIPVYAQGNIHNHAPDRPRKLLVHRREIAGWAKTAREKGTTIVPLSLYFKGHLVKVEMALVRGKKLFDKREDQKKRSAQREIDRELGRRR